MFLANKEKYSQFVYFYQISYIIRNCIFYALKSGVFWQFAMRGSWRCQTKNLFNDTDGN